MFIRQAEVVSNLFLPLFFINQQICLMKKNLLTLFASLFLISTTGVFAQGTVTLGNDTTSNGPFAHPTPYGSHYNNLRVQYLIMDYELTSLGLLPGEISALAFHVKQLNNCLPLPNFKISLKHTTAQELTQVFDNVGFNQVYHVASYTPQTGWNTHYFTNPFFWDGESNLLVDVCFTFIQGNYTKNASVFYTNTPGRNTSAYFRSTTVPACGTTYSATVAGNRANMQITGLLSDCLPPSGLSTSDLTTNSALLSWATSGNETGWHLIYGDPGFNPDNSGILIENLLSNSYTLTGLATHTSYDYYVKAVCSNGSTSGWSGPYTFTTLYVSFPVPFSENFPASSFPAFWTQTYSGGLTANLWLLSNTSLAGGQPYEMRSKWVTQTGISRLVTPLIDLSNASSAILKFRHFYDDWSAGCTLKVQTSFDGVNWVDEAFSFQSGYGDIGPDTITISLTTHSPATRIAWVMDGDHNGIDFWYVDNVYVSAVIQTLNGDANCDGTVNLLDIIAIANEILNQNPQPFCYGNADINQDGIINLLDLIGTAILILGG